MGDKTWSALFDNSKVKSVAGPFEASQDLDVAAPASLQLELPKWLCPHQQINERNSVLQSILSVHLLVGSHDNFDPFPAEKQSEVSRLP